MSENFATSSVLTDGFAIVLDVIAQSQIQILVGALTTPVEDSSDRRKVSGRHAMRNLLSITAIRSLAESPAMMNLVNPILGSASRPVRGILFDKTPGANWKVAWHQDLSIAVKRRVDAAEYGPWSVKAGVQHVQPPVSVLENMVTIRLHVDDCDEDNGPLRVLPGSHLLGILNDDAIAIRRNQTQAVTCICPAGGALLMRPLLLHASSQARSPRHRRVIHIEYAAHSLPAGLEWYER